MRLSSSTTGTNCPLLALALTIALAAAPAAAAPAPANDKPITLDTFEVYATRINWERWTRAQTSHFEILTNLDDTQFVASVAAKTERIITLFETRSPLFDPQRDLPAKLILVDDDMADRLLSQTRNDPASTQTDFDARMTGAPFFKPTRQFDNRHKLPALAGHTDEQLLIVKLLAKSYMAATDPEPEHPGHPGSQSAARDKNDKALACAADLALAYLNASVRLRTGAEPAPWLAAALNAMRGHDSSDDNYFMKSSDDYDRFNSKVYGKLFLPPAEFAKKTGKPFSPAELRANSGKTALDYTFYHTRWIGIDADTLTLGRYCLFCEMAAIRTARDFPATTRKQTELWENFMLAPGAINLGDIFTAAYYPPAAEVRPLQRQLLLQREARDFLYYCLFGPDRATRAAFTNFVLATSADSTFSPSALQPFSPSSAEPLFEKILGSTYAQFQAAIYAYYQKISQGHPLADNPWGSTGFTVDLMPTEPVLLQSARRADTTRIIADWFDASGAAPRARALLLKTIADSPQSAQDPQLLATLALDEARHGDPQKAIPLLEQAAAANITRPQVYRTLATLYLDAALHPKSPAASPGAAAPTRNSKLGTGNSGGEAAARLLTAAELDKVLAPLAIAFEQSPPSPQNYILYAAACDHAAAPDAAFETLIPEACEKFPGDIDMLERILPAYARRGYKDEALQLARDALASPQNSQLPPAKKHRLDKLLENLEHPGNNFPPTGNNQL